jgi:hypothetical protein
MKRPGGGPWPKFTYTKGRPNQETTVAVDDLGVMGHGSISLDFLAEPLDLPPSLDFSVRGEFRVSETGVLGSTYTAESTIRFTVERESA